MKKMVSLFLSVLLMLSCVGVANAAETKKFQDVPENAWYRDAVYDMVGKGVLNGTGEKSFSPDDYMTRAMFAQVLYNMTENKTTVDYGVKRFVDTEKGKWYYDAVQWAGINKIAGGVSATKYDPNGILTREQAVTLLFNYILATGNASYGHEWDVVGAFADGKYVSPWANIPMEWAISGGIIAGVTPHTLEPQAYLTRAQAAQILSRAYPELKHRELVPEDTGKTAPTNAILGYLNKTVKEVEKEFTLVQVNPPEFKFSDEYYVKDNPSCKLYFYQDDSYNKTEKVLTTIYMKLDDIMPELSGKTVGEAIRILGRGNTEFYSNESTAETGEVLFYYVDGFWLQLPVHDDLTFDKDANVIVSQSWQYTVSAGPDDGKITQYLGKKPIFTYTLPASWKDKYLLRTNNSMAKGYQNYVVHERINVVRGGSGYLFSFETLPIGEKPIWGEDRTTKISQIEVDGTQYVIYLKKFDAGSPLVDDNDIEAAQSYKALEKEIDQVAKSIDYAKDVTVK